MIQHKNSVIARHPNQLEYFKWCHSNRYITTHIFKPSLGIQRAPKVKYKRMQVKNVRKLLKIQQMNTTRAPRISIANIRWLEQHTSSKHNTTVVELRSILSLPLHFYFPVLLILVPTCLRPRHAGTLAIPWPVSRDTQSPSLRFQTCSRRHGHAVD